MRNFSKKETARIKIMLETLTSNYHLSKTIGSEKDLITPHIFAPPSYGEQRRHQQPNIYLPVVSRLERTAAAAERLCTSNDVKVTRS